MPTRTSVPTIFCNEETDSCIHPNDAAECDDGDPCTVNGVCSGGDCAGVAAPECTTTTTLEPQALCGDANADGEVKSGDALIALKTAVGSADCPHVRCDFNGDGQVKSGDALAILKTAVGVEVEANCPGAEPTGSGTVGSTSTTSTLP